MNIIREKSAESTGDGRGGQGRLQVCSGTEMRVGWGTESVRIEQYR